MKVPGGEARRVRGKWVVDVTRPKTENRWDVYRHDNDGSMDYVGQWVGTPTDFNPWAVDTGRSQ